MPDELHFRNVMSHLATGVTVVATTDPDGNPCGLTANAVTSVSLVPPLVLVCIGVSSTTLPAILEKGFFSVSVLGSGDEALARRFAQGESSSRFQGVPHRAEVTGAPVLEAALAWMDCRIHAVHEAGDHVIVVGTVVASAARKGSPLLFFRSTYHGGPP